MVRKFIIAIAATATLGAALSPTGALAARWGGGHGGCFATKPICVAIGGSAIPPTSRGIAPTSAATVQTFAGTGGISFATGPTFGPISSTSAVTVGICSGTAAATNQVG